ncbi:MAG: hypothetical protein ACTSSP_00405 [Candidatus Asgardarchaeia archaeon]
MENLVKKHLEELKLISSDQYLTSFFIEGQEWEVYQVEDKTLLYIYFELLDNSMGYAFCIKIACGEMKCDVDPFYHIKNFDNFSVAKWEDCGQYIKDQLTYDAIYRMKAYGST